MEFSYVVPMPQPTMDSLQQVVQSLFAYTLFFSDFFYIRDSDLSYSACI